MLGAIEAHLGSRQVSRVIYGTIIGVALIAAVEAHPPSPGVVVGWLLGTAVAVGLAELYSDVIAMEARHRRPVRTTELRAALGDVTAVALAIASPAVFFVLAAADVIEEDTAFTVAKWSAVGLLGGYGFAASHLAGRSRAASGLRGLAIGLLGAVLVLLKALVH